MYKLRTLLNMLSEDQKKWMASAMICMILADGRVDKEEVDALQIALGVLHDVDVIEDLKQRVHDQRMPEMGMFPDPPLGWRERSLIMIDIIHVAISDREISAGEQKSVMELGQLMGFPESKLEELIKHGTNLIRTMEEHPS